MNSKIENDDYKQFGDKLRTLRESTGMSQATFAELFGMPQQTYQGYESGSRKITLPFLRKLSCYFSVSIDYLAENNSIYRSDKENRPVFNVSKNSASYNTSDILTATELDLIQLWRNASSDGQDAAKTVLIAYKKPDSKNCAM